MIERTLAALAATLRTFVRLGRSEVPDPSAPRRAIVLGTFVVAFGLWMALRTILLLRRRPVCVEGRTSEGHTLDCPLPDMIPMYLYLFGVWEPDVTAYLRRALAPGDVMIDVGANHGAFTLLAAGIVGPRGRVVAVEAMPAMADALRRNLRRNAVAIDGPAESGSGATIASEGRMAPVSVIVAAASDVEGTLTVYSGPAHNLGRTTTLRERGEEAVATVRAAPLTALVDADLLRAARLIKIDVEGAEPAVLAGLAQAAHTLHRDVEIMVELSPHWWPAEAPDAAAVLGPLLRAGFRVYELPNVYWPWRYAFPNRVSPPKPLMEPLGTLRRRVDLVLSRRDLPML